MMGIASLFSFTFSIPHYFFTVALGKNCRPYHRYMGQWYNALYFWLSMIINFVFPFLCLLVFNSCIIYNIHHSLKGTVRRTSVSNKSEVQEDENSQTNRTQRQKEQSQRKNKFKSSEKQIFTTLLLVTFSFLILITPSYTFFFYNRLNNFVPTPKSLGIFYLCQQIAHKTFYVNNSINFLLYVLSGTKFRTDVLRLFHCSKQGRDSSSTSRSHDSTSGKPETSVTNYI